jgi:release factor glutamine methyltransferase
VPVAQTDIASFNAPGIYSDPRALAVFSKLAASLRQIGYMNQRQSGEAEGISTFALGWPVDAGTLVPHLSFTDLDILLRSGAADWDDDRIFPRFELFAAGSILALIPHETCVDEVAYLGPDSLWLLETAWRLAPGGDCAVELGTGTGFLAAALSRRYLRTLATDLKPWTVSVAGITLALNPWPGAATAVRTADVAEGLQPASFDLVVANPPWVPQQNPNRPARLFADGGPTGFELPRRFIVDGSALLTPGGVGIFLCLDLQFADGLRPLKDLCAELTTEGYQLNIRRAPLGSRWIDYTKDLRSAMPDLSQARLVAVVVNRN